VHARLVDGHAPFSGQERFDRLRVDAQAVAAEPAARDQ
jgi:hypothetical protein